MEPDTCPFTREPCKPGRVYCTKFCWEASLQGKSVLADVQYIHAAAAEQIGPAAPTRQVPIAEDFAAIRRGMGRP